MQHFVLYYNYLYMIVNFYFVDGKMYAEMALPELPDEPHYPVRT